MQNVTIFVFRKATNMNTITNTTGSKKVNITTDGTGMVRAMFVQVYHNEEQVLESKSFKTIKKAEQWAKTKVA